MAKTYTIVFILDFVLNLSGSKILSWLRLRVYFILEFLFGWKNYFYSPCQSSGVVNNQYIYGSYFLYIRVKPDTHLIYFVIFLTIPVRYFPRDVLLVGILSFPELGKWLLHRANNFLPAGPREGCVPGGIEPEAAEQQLRALTTYLRRTLNYLRRTLLSTPHPT